MRKKYVVKKIWKRFWKRSTTPNWQSLARRMLNHHSGTLARLSFRTCTTTCTYLPCFSAIESLTASSTIGSMNIIEPIRKKKKMDLRKYRAHIRRVEGGLQKKDLEKRRAFNLAKRHIPATYLPETLSPDDYKRQKANILRRRDRYKNKEYVEGVHLPSYKSKESKHIRRAKKMYGIASMEDLETLQKRTGCSKESMETILRKGRGAYYSSGSRPNQTAESWARARLASSVTGGKAAKYDYKHLEEGGCNANVLSMAQQWMKGGNDYPWMTYKEAHKMEVKAAKHGVSVVARGPGGFMRVYEANPSKLKMQRVMYSGTQSWAMRRRNFIKRHLAQYVKHPTPRRWLAMVMWAYRHEILH